MGVIIPESDMEFGVYKEEQIFCIEKCRQYTEKLRQRGVRCCEFILLRSNKLCFIEAKRSYPDPIGGIAKDEKQYYTDIKEIAEKMRHSLQLYANIVLNRYSPGWRFGRNEKCRESRNKVNISDKKCGQVLDSSSSRCI